MKFIAVLKRDEEEGVWHALLQEEERVHTYGRSVRAALGHLRDAASLWFEVEPAEVELEPALDEGMPAYDLLVRTNDARRQLVVFEVKARQVTAEAVRNMSDNGFSRRDIAELVGVSHQRVQQLLEVAADEEVSGGADVQANVAASSTADLGRRRKPRVG